MTIGGASADALRRPLSKPEQEGWRQLWDGWDICPSCVEATLAKPNNAHWDGVWPVPVDYAMSIKETARCCKCHVTYAPNQPPSKDRDK